MNISGFIPFSTTDYPGALAAVLFCQGCPWRCRYCHNPHLQRFEEGTIMWDTVARFLRTRQGLLDGVVFSGGEPTAQSDLAERLVFVRELGYKTGIHTAGACFNGLLEALPHADWIGFDVKAMPNEYEKVTQTPDSGKNVRRCLEVIVAAGVECEVRVTVHPMLLSDVDVYNVAKLAFSIGISRFVLQRFRDKGCVDEELSSADRGQFSEELLKDLDSMFGSVLVR